MAWPCARGWRREPTDAAQSGPRGSSVGIPKFPASLGGGPASCTKSGKRRMPRKELAQVKGPGKKSPSNYRTGMTRASGQARRRTWQAQGIARSLSGTKGDARNRRRFGCGRPADRCVRSRLVRASCLRIYAVERRSNARWPGRAFSCCPRSPRPRSAKAASVCHRVLRSGAFDIPPRRER